MTIPTDPITPKELKMAWEFARTFWRVKEPNAPDAYRVDLREVRRIPIMLQDDVRQPDTRIMYVEFRRSLEDRFGPVVVITCPSAPEYIRIYSA